MKYFLLKEISIQNIFLKENANKFKKQSPPLINILKHNIYNIKVLQFNKTTTFLKSDSKQCFFNQDIWSNSQEKMTSFLQLKAKILKINCTEAPSYCYSDAFRILKYPDDGWIILINKEKPTQCTISMASLVWRYVIQQFTFLLISHLF